MLICADTSITQRVGGTHAIDAQAPRHWNTDQNIWRIGSNFKWTWLSKRLWNSMAKGVFPLKIWRGTMPKFKLHENSISIEIHQIPIGAAPPIEFCKNSMGHKFQVKKLQKSSPDFEQRPIEILSSIRSLDFEGPQLNSWPAQLVTWKIQLAK